MYYFCSFFSADVCFPQRINFYSDWKVITMFIGGNDFCDSCQEPVCSLNQLTLYRAFIIFIMF